MGAKPIERIDRHKDGASKPRATPSMTCWDIVARECGLDTLKMANGQVNRRLMTPVEKSSKSVKLDLPIEHLSLPKSESPAGGWGGALS